LDSFENKLATIIAVKGFHVKHGVQRYHPSLQWSRRLIV